MKPHKHADILRALADGHEIEWRPVAEQGAWNHLLAASAITTLVDGELDHLEYRIKPEKKWYRVANTTDQGLWIAENEREERLFESLSEFKRWITDRIYYE